MRSGRGRAYGRAALAGNPSDGYGGRVLAVALRELRADAEVAAAERDEAGGALAAAAVTRFRARFAECDAPVAVRWATTVPREVGLAGSSAIVIAVLRALCDAHGVALEPRELAEMALAAETEELGIAAGLQDRLVQAHEALLDMDFATGAVDVLDPELLPPLYVAWHPEAASPSGAIHAELRARHAAGDAGVRAAMDELAALAAGAREALLAGDAGRFAACVDGSLAARARVMPIHPRVERMARAARAAGGSANSAGSGGAVVGTVPDGAWPALRRGLEKEGCGVLRPRA